MTTKSISRRLVGTLIASLAVACAAPITIEDANSQLIGAHTSVIFAEVKDVNREAFVPIRLRSIGTLTGQFDCGVVPGISFESTKVYQDNQRLPVPGDKVILVVDESGDGDFRGARERVGYMPGYHSPFRIVTDVSDPEFISTLDALRSLRKNQKGKEEGQSRDGSTFWSTHFLVYGAIRGTAESKTSDRQLSIDFRPVLTIAGSFDAARVPELSARVELSPESGAHTTPLGPYALILLAREGSSSYAVSRERKDFMPGDHASICVMKRFSDATVINTLRRIQEARAKEKKSEKDAAKAEKGK